MAEEINPAVLQATKDSLGKFIKKPPLTDKLLGKPPFKFLHDIFSVVIKEHGLMEGLFTAAEMKSDSFKDKESKVTYIQKVIDVMEFVSGERLHIKPGKVVAGLETAKTNALLQSIGKALSSKATSGEAVKKVLSGEKPGKKKDKDKDKDKTKKKDKDGASPKKPKGGASLSDATNKSPDKKAKKDKDDKKKSKKDDGDEKAKKSKDKDGDKPKKKKGEGKDDDKAKKGKEEKEGKKKKTSEPPEEEAAPPAPVAAPEAPEPEPEPEQEPEEEGPAVLESRPPSQRPASGRPSSQRPASGRPSSQRPASGRPGSVRPGRAASRAATAAALDEDEEKKIPKFEDIMADIAPTGSEPGVEAQPELQMETKEAEEQGDITMDTTVPLSDGGTGFSAPRPRTARSARPSSARPAAPRPKQRAAIEQQLDDVTPSGGAATATVMFDEDDDDDDHFVVEEKKLAPDPGLAAVMQGEENLAEQAEEGEHGLLVSQILETKKSMEEELRGKTQIERDSGADKGKSRDKEAVRKEVVRLRESIQKVTKSANPLGKMMDFLQEDVDSMQRELDKWRAENKGMTQQIRSEMDTTNTSIEPLKAALSEYEQSIQDQLDKISAVRASVLNNEKKIAKMMAGVMNVAASAP